MRDRSALLGIAVAAALGAGCSGLALDPWPDIPAEKQGPVKHGLDPFPAAMHPHESADTGLDPFPRAVHPEGQGPVGLNPFPAAMHRHESANLGLHPFPAALHPEGQDPFGLNPFPAAMHPHESADLGLHPFPEAMHPEGQAALGLNPFPAAMHRHQSGSLGLNPFPDNVKSRSARGTGGPVTGIPKSDEYPDAPPVDVKPIPKSKAPVEKPEPDDGKAK